MVDLAVQWTTLPDPVSSYLAVGIKVDSVNDAAVTPAQGPIQNEHADWLMWKICPPGEGMGGADNAFCHFDLRSKRKLEELDESFFLYMFAQNTPASVRAVVQTLLLLP